MDPKGVAKVIEELSNGIIDNLPQTFFHETLLATYFVGTTDRDDRAERMYTLVAVTSTYFVHQPFGVTEGSPVCQSLEDLGISMCCSYGEVVLVPLKDRSPRMLTGRLFFIPHVRPSESREVTISYSWLGTWKPLREKGKDRGEFAIHQKAKHFELRIILAKELGGARFVDLSGQGITEHAEVNEDGQQILICRGANVESQHVSYVVELT